MLYLENEFLFLHIPRTSGISLCNTFIRNYPEEIHQLNLCMGRLTHELWRHSRAYLLQDLIDEWGTLRKFTIVRNPWRLIESNWNYFLHVLANQKHTFCYLRERGAVEEIQRITAQDFNYFVQTHYKFLIKGFYHFWCLHPGTDADLGVQAFKYEELDEQWPNLCGLMQLPEDTERIRMNGTPLQFDEIWSADSIDYIQEKCRHDFELFDYPREP